MRIMKTSRTVLDDRRDILATTNTALSKAMLRAYQDAGSLAAPLDRRDLPPAETSERISLRTNLIEAPSSDPTGFERVIGESDLTSINYLDRGRRAAAAVCRVRVPADGGEWYGTGFLVGPRLLMTNHHVLGSPAEASQGEAEFGYEHDLDGVLQPPVQFNLCPHEVFFTDAELDVTFVSVAPLSNGGVPIDRYGWLVLLPVSGKGIDKEWVTIIQHPGGGPKQISIRSSRIVSLRDAAPSVNTDLFIHYLTDTEPGSSGAPRVNDQWQVVALHHKAVPAPRDKAKRGTPGSGIVNGGVGVEGGGVSRRYGWCGVRRLENPEAGRFLDGLEGALGFTWMSDTVPSEEKDVFEKDAAPFARTRWSKKAGIGYDSSFLSEVI